MTSRPGSREMKSSRCEIDARCAVKSSSSQLITLAQDEDGCQISSPNESVPPRGLSLPRAAKRRLSVWRTGSRCSRRMGRTPACGHKHPAGATLIVASRCLSKQNGRNLCDESQIPNSSPHHRRNSAADCLNPIGLGSNAPSQT